MKKRDLLSRLVTPTGTKGCASHVGAGSTFCPGWCYQPGQKVLFCPGCQTRDKRAPLLSRTGVPGWETGTTAVFQPGQINIFVVVSDPPRLIYGDRPAGGGGVKDKLDGTDRRHIIAASASLPPLPLHPRRTSIDQSCAVPFAMCSACPSHE